jgi:hypothetical protein
MKRTGFGLSDCAALGKSLDFSELQGLHLSTWVLVRSCIVTQNTELHLEEQSYAGGKAWKS